MKTSIYLVHGTWPEGPPVPRSVAAFLGFLGSVARVLSRRPARAPETLWYRDRSSFRVGLSRQLEIDHEYVEIPWSGRNTLRARLEGAARLKAELAAGFARNPRGRHVVVAHSHGGNAAMYGVNSLDADCLPHGIATLATPFVEIRRRKILKIDRFFDNILAGLGFIVYILVMGMFQSVNGVLAMLWLVGVPCLYVFLMNRKNRRRSPARGGRRPIYEAVIRRRRAIFRRGRPSLLVVRANNDEATITLSIANLASLLNRKVWTLAILVFNCYMILTRLAYVLAVGAFTILMGITLIVVPIHVPMIYIFGEKRVQGLGMGYLKSPLQYLNDWTPVLSLEDPRARLTVAATLVVFVTSLSVLGVAVLALRIIGRLLLTPFGVELFFIADTVASRVNIAPTGVLTRFYLVPDADVTGGLRHAVYRSTSAHAELARWIRSLEMPTEGVHATPSAACCSDGEPPDRG